MKIRYAILIGLIFVGGVGYAHLGTAGKFFPAGKNEYTQKSKQAAPTAGRSENMLTDHPSSDVAYAIVVMPKSYLPLLKQFSRSQIARNLKILPAQIGWNDGHPIVIPKQGALKTANKRTSHAEKDYSPAGTGDITGRTEGTIVLRKAALLMLLQGSLGGKLNYRRDRSLTSVSSTLHR